MARESSEPRITLLIFAPWMPAFAGMTVVCMKRYIFLLVSSFFLFSIFSLLSPTAHAQSGNCGKDIYNGKLTYCSLAQIFNNGVAPYGGCGLGQQCFIGDSAGSLNCNWVVDNDGLKFCFGGFSSRDQLRATHMEFRCSNNCGGANVINGTAGLPAFMAGKVVQTYSNSDAPDSLIGYEKDGYFSCIQVGGFDESVIAATRYQIQTISTACGVAGLGEFVALSATGAKLIAGVGGIVSKLTLPVKLTSAASASLITSACLSAINNYHPEIETKVAYQNGTIACQRYMTLNVAADETVTSTGENYGAPSPGVVLQKGTSGGFGVQMCTPNGQDANSGIQTAIGCIPTSTTGLFTTFFQLFFGLAGGITLLMIIIGGLKILLSSGNPDRVREGQETITAAIAGLVLIILSIFLLRVIGVDILGIPGFS
jgi:hypothetical protein